MLGSLISAGASLLGGLFGKSSADDARAATERANERNIQLQKEFAQNGIQWKTADARKAGLHPLYALGASTPSFSPVSSNFASDTSMATAISSAGQDIGRAVNATRSTTDRADAFSATMGKLALEKAGLENDILRTDLASRVGRLRQQANPGMPVGQRYLTGLEGQGSAPAINIQEKNERSSADPTAPHREAFAVTDLGHTRTAGGGYSAVPSADAKQRIEDSIIQEALWAFRNNILPSFGINQSPPPVPAGKGEKWLYNPFFQEYRKHSRVPYLPFDVYW